MKVKCVRFYLFSLLLVCTTLGFAQGNKVTGRVLNDESKQLQGVSVLVRGKAIGTQTNSAGDFSIVASKGDVLVFTATGFKLQEVRLGTNLVIDLSLEPMIGTLEDVVVTGYGTQKRKEVTGAVATINPKTFEHNPTTNVATVLQGNVPGLRVQQRTGQPGATPNITFRGGTEFGGGGTPLFIVDGVIVPSLYGIDINDVGSIDLLKDAATTAIYGARAANGVVLVTTKKGKKGAPGTQTHAEGGSKIRGGQRSGGAPQVQRKAGPSGSGSAG